MEFSVLNTAVSGLIAFFFLYLFHLKKPKNRAPPQAGGAWPIIGHLRLLGGPELPHITLGALADKYGPIFTIWLGQRRVVVVSNWETAKELFTNFDVAVSSRPKTVASEHLGYDYAMFGFSPYGAYWRELRKITSLELLSNRRLELLKHIRVSETETSVKELYRLWKEKREASDQVLTEMKHWFGDLTLNVVLRMVAGKRYFGAVAVADEKAARRCQKVMREFFHLTGLFVVADALPFLRWLDFGGYEKIMIETAREMDNMVEEWVDEHRRKRNSGEATDGQDFMDVMLSVCEGSDLGGFDSNTIVKATCISLIAGGSYTTTVMLTWTLSLLLNNRYALKKVQDELDTQVVRDRQVNESDINKLVYLQAVVKETLRLYPAGPLSGFREFTEDCVVDGHHVPKGTRLILNLWKIQRDPRIWIDPSEFRPERFLTTHKDVDVKGHHFELIPFGAGRRICPGTTFGLQMVHLILASLIHSFDLFTPAGKLVDMTESAGLTNIKATPLEVLVVPRLATKLY